MSKNVLITGASGGIGKAMATAFAKDGYNVILHYYSNKNAVQELADNLSEKFKVKSLIVQADVADRKSIYNMYNEIDKVFENVDILINNSGIAQQKLFTDISADDWRNMIGVNLDGVFNCTQEALSRYMIRNHSGIILNISSMWGQIGASCEVHYSAAKAGVIGLTKALAKEVGLSNIRVNCICPGVIMTDMMKNFDEQTLDELKSETPLNKLGTPQDVANAAVFLCSEQANFITGQVLGVNGGFVI